MKSIEKWVDPATTNLSPRLGHRLGGHRWRVLGAGMRDVGLGNSESLAWHGLGRSVTARPLSSRSRHLAAGCHWVGLSPHQKMIGCVPAAPLRDRDDNFTCGCGYPADI
jgi:hypothetical protein